MLGETTARRQKAKIRWTPRLIRRLRGRRTQSELGSLLGVAKNTVWRWEAGQAHPDHRCVARLSELAESEGFLEDWKLVGSMRLAGDLESARTEVAELFRSSLDRTTGQLAD